MDEKKKQASGPVKWILIGISVIFLFVMLVLPLVVVVTLTLKEYEMLLLFVRNPGVALYRETIYERVWDEPYYGDTRTVDLHVQRLRKKLNLSDEIQSVYKIGYRFKADDL